VNKSRNYYDVKELSDMLGICPHTVRKMIKDKTISGDKLGRTWVVTKSAYNEWWANFGK
jgi:excisionase family DNA binding protein